MIALPAALPLSIRQLLIHARETLKAAGIENFRREADWLLAHALELSTNTILTDRESTLSAPQAAEAWSLVERRARREPLQYILGTQEFKGWTLHVTPDVLIPRPETELLVDEVLTCLAQRPAAVIADIGTGSGCIAVAIAKSCAHASVYAVDISAPALAVAKTNIAQHGLLHRVTLVQSDLVECFSQSGGGIFDVVVSNPPYIPEAEVAGLQPEVARYEPRLALAAGPDGLENYRRLLISAPGLLKPNGYMIFELGVGHAGDVLRMVADRTELAVVRCRRDEAGIERVLVLRKVA